MSSRRQFLKTSGMAFAAVPSALNAAASSKIKIAQIGTKHAHASGKMSSIRSLDSIYEMVGVAEADPAALQSAKQNKAYQSLSWLNERDLLRTPGLQAVAVETDIPDLMPTGIRCIERGLHIHLDKPAGDNLQECQRLHDAAKANGVTIQMGYMLRYNPGFEFLFDVLKKGWLGPIREVNGNMGKYSPDQSRQHMARYSGGGMFELACHIIDAVVTVLGEPSKVIPITKRTYSKKDSFADNQLAIFEYPEAIATIGCNHIDRMGGPRRSFEVVGEEGTLEIKPLEAPKVRLGLSKAKEGFKRGFQDIPLRKATGRYDDEFRDLAKIIRGEKKLAWSHEHDLIVQDCVLKASEM